jgi:hypothetical protein
MRQSLLYGSLVVFVAALGVSWVTHGTGVVQDDPDRNISIPGELTVPLQLKAAYNGRDIFFRYRWPSERPHLYIDMLRYTDGQWARHGRSPVGPEPDGMYEDRVTMLVDDGSVPEFQRYGGYITAGDGMRFFTGEATAEQVRAHPISVKHSANQMCASICLEPAAMFRTGPQWSISGRWRHSGRPATSSIYGIGGHIAPTR